MNYSREIMAEILVDNGELINRGDDFFEDMGGHIIHESQIGSYFENFMKNLKPQERKAIIFEYINSEI